jgi:CRP-like cAMP-binding protein
MMSSELQSKVGDISGRYLVLDCDFNVIFASDAYLEEIGGRREEIVGRRVFDIVPDERNAADASAVAAAAASLSRVLRLKQAERWSFHPPEAVDAEGLSASGSIAHRYLLPMNTPVLDDAGEVRWIVLSEEEVTGLPRQEHRQPPSTSRSSIFERLRGANGVLDALPDPLFEALRDHLVPVEFHPDQVVLAQQEPAGSVYFSFSGLYAIVRQLHDGSSIQVALAGNSWVFGLEALGGSAGNPLEVQALVGGWALVIRAGILTGLMNAHPQLRAQLGQLSVDLIAQIGQTAACNARHSVDQRVALWLMTASERLGTLELHVTQERISMLLGTRRASISEALGRLSAAGLVTTARHAITIRHRPLLQRCACPCYEESLGRSAAEPFRRVSMDPEFALSLAGLMNSCAASPRF